LMRNGHIACFGHIDQPQLKQPGSPIRVVRSGARDSLFLTPVAVLAKCPRTN
jgi:hypothetical protein